MRTEFVPSAIILVGSLSVAFLVSACSGSIGSACDSHKEAATKQACTDAKGRDVVVACLAAADSDGQCAGASTGDYHYDYLFQQAIETAMAGAHMGGKRGYELGGKAMRILQSIASDPHAPI